MAFRYVPAVLQSGANVLGHIPGSNKPCAKRGVIRCVVPFGTGEVDYNSYMSVPFDTLTVVVFAD